MPENLGMRILRLIPAVLVAAGVAACGSSQNSADTQQAVATVTTTTTVTPTVTSASSSTPAEQSSTTTAASSSAGGPPPCTARDLAASFLGGQGATGHGELGFALRNTGSTACSTVGYPGVQFLDQAGATLPTQPTHTTSDFFGNLPLKSLVVAPGQSVSFRLGVTHGAASEAGCTTAYGLQVIAPNDTATLTTSIPNGAYECQTATVSPLQPGDTAYH